MTMWMCAVFAAVALGVALYAFFGISGIADPADRDAAIGYALFWGFLGVIAVAFGVLSWMIKQGKFGPTD